MRRRHDVRARLDSVVALRAALIATAFAWTDVLLRSARQPKRALATYRQAAGISDRAEAGR